MSGVEVATTRRTSAAVCQRPGCEWAPFARLSDVMYAAAVHVAQQGHIVTVTEQRIVVYSPRGSVPS